MRADRRYLRDVARLLPYGGRAKRAYMKNLRRDVAEYRQNHPGCTYGALEQHFGTARALAAYVLEETDKVQLASMFRLNRRLIYGGLGVVVVASIVTAAASVQRAIMTHDFVHGYYVEEIYDASELLPDNPKPSPVAVPTLSPSPSPAPVQAAR